MVLCTRVFVDAAVVVTKSSRIGWGRSKKHMRARCTVFARFALVF